MRDSLEIPVKDVMRPIGIEVLRRLPKAELHCHLDGSVRPETLIDIGKRRGVAMPRGDARSLREYMVVKDARNLEDYLARFEVTLAVMQRADALERIAYELAEDAHRDGVFYIEVRFCPLLNTQGGLSEQEAVEAVLKGLARAEGDHGILARLIVTAMRGMPPEKSMDMARLAVSYRHQGVVGFDLAGGEFGNPASVHAKAFEYARSHDVACTCHAGEGDGGSSVRDALHACCVHRIGHGTRLFEDQSLLEFVNDRRVPVEICLTSNVQTRAAASYAQHPAKRYFDAGLKIVLNTDNRLMSGTTLTDEYANAVAHLGFSFGELARVAMNGFDSAFLPWKERNALVARARVTIEQLAREVLA
jgi:adenosine deaminase